MPGPPSRARTTNSTRIRVASALKYWARPPHTPASLRLVRLRYSLRVWAMAPPFARCLQGKLTTVREAVVPWVGESIERHELTATTEDDPRSIRDRPDDAVSGVAQLGRHVGRPKHCLTSTVAGAVG